MNKNNSLVESLNEYFRVLHESDAEGASRLFHQDCWLFSPDSDDTIKALHVRDYLEVLRQRVSPRDKGERLYGQVITIDQTGPKTAFAKVFSAVQPKFFLDYLTFVGDSSGWRIVSKVYREVALAESYGITEFTGDQS